MRADLFPVRDVAVVSDGGVVFSEGIDGLAGVGPVPGRIRYLAPASPGRFVAAVRRDRAGVFRLGSAVAVSVALSVPATVSLSLSRDGRRVAAAEVSLPAGTSRVALGANLPAAAHDIQLTAMRILSGRIATDRTAAVPLGWLPDELARYVAQGVIFTATDWGGYQDSGMLGCRRIAAVRVDCRLAQEGARCDRVVAVWLNGRRAAALGGLSLPSAGASALDAAPTRIGAQGLLLR